MLIQRRKRYEALDCPVYGVFAVVDGSAGHGGGAAVVNFLARDGVVCMNAMLTPLDGLSGCQSATDVSLWLARRTVPAVCTEVNVE